MCHHIVKYGSELHNVVRIKKCFPNSDFKENGRVKTLRKSSAKLTFLVCKQIFVVNCVFDTATEHKNYKLFYYYFLIIFLGFYVTSVFTILSFIGLAMLFGSDLFETGIQKVPK